MFTDVAINIPSKKTFTYHVPRKMEKFLIIGKRVLVPFGKRRLTGYVTDISERTEREDIKDIIDILDAEPLFAKEDLKFYRWAADYYMHPLGKSLKVMLPGGIDVESSLWIVPSADMTKATEKKLSDTQGRIMGILKEHPGGLSIKKIKRGLGIGTITNDIKTLQVSGFLNTEGRLNKPGIKAKKELIIKAVHSPPPDVKLTEKQKNILALLTNRGEATLSSLQNTFKNIRPTIKSMERKCAIHTFEREVMRAPQKPSDIGTNNKTIILNDEQKVALEEIVRGIKSKRYSPYLLHGVTGSGKTEVYLKAIEKALSLKGSALFLVPEIALTPQLISRIKEKFDENIIAILHSGIGRSSRYDEWRRIMRGDARIIIGARSGIFAPARNLRLIVVDEEHDNSYKQDDRLTYNARDLALVKARLSSATIILGSATPGLQTFFNIKGKNIHYLPLTKRVVERPLPRVEIVDMKQEREKRGNVSILSRSLKEAIQNTLDEKKQTLIFLNRRGFNTFLYCLDCGYVFRCLNCSVSMTHHISNSALRCHYCDYAIKAPPVCPVCAGSKIHSYGMGTEKLQEEIEALFPRARVERMDSDTTTKKGSYERILRALDKGSIDILVGTQMIAKGHDFPNVTLVGVISADTSLNIPDFRSAENTFQILTQVSGRGGRGDSPGKVIVQTFNPEHYSIKHARDHNYIGFYSDEIIKRKELSYPPFSRMVKLRISSTKAVKAKECAKRAGIVARELSRDCSIDILGPAEAPIARIKGKYRWHILLRGKDVKVLHALSGKILEKIGKPIADIKLDVDPMNFM